MTRRADYGGIVRYSAPLISSGSPVDTQEVRTITNNVLHYLDEDGHVICVRPPGESSFSASYSASETYQKMWGGTYLVRVDAKLKPYPIRIRIYGGVQGAASTWRFWVVAGSQRNGKGHIGFAGNNVLYAEHTYAAAAQSWQTTYKPDGTASTLLEPGEEHAVRQRVSTLTGLSGSNTSVRYSTIDLSMWAQNISGATGSLRCSGFYAAQVCGA